MKIVIDTKQCPCRTLNDKCDISNNECYEDDICSTCPLIRNGGVKLPKGHGRLKDIDRLESHDEYDGQGFTKSVYKDDIDDAPTIIEADKGSGE